MRLGSTSWSAAMSWNEFSDTVTTRGNALGHPGLHVGERVPAAQRQPLVPALGVLELEPAVDGDRVVDGAEHRAARRCSMASSPYPRHWLSCTRSNSPGRAVQVPPRPQAERQRLGELAERERGDLGEVGPVLQLPQARHPHGEVVVVDVEAGQFDQRNPRIELRDRADRPAPRRGGPGPPGPWRGGARRRPGHRRGACPGRPAERCATTLLGVHSRYLSVQLTVRSRPPALTAVIHHDRGPPSWGGVAVTSG